MISLVVTTFCTRSNKFNLIQWTYSCFSLEPYKDGSGHETRCSPWVTCDHVYEPPPIVWLENCIIKIRSSYRSSPDVVTLCVEPQFTTVYKRSHCTIVTMATQNKQPTVAWLETLGWLSWLHLEPNLIDGMDIYTEIRELRTPKLAVVVRCEWCLNEDLGQWNLVWWWQLSFLTCKQHPRTRGHKSFTPSLYLFISPFIRSQVPALHLCRNQLRRQWNG